QEICGTCGRDRGALFPRGVLSANNAIPRETDSDRAQVDPTAANAFNMIGTREIAMRLPATICIVLGSFVSAPALAQHAVEHNMESQHMSMGHEHGDSGVPVTYAELTRTATLLEQAREATAKYQEVHAAEGDGYKAIGPDVPGMGIHYVGPHSATFNVE